MRVRLAPSPTGKLHIGTARTALFNWLFAFHEKGQFLLRIEDTDKERSKTEFTTNILEGLEWLGINWTESPVLQSSQIQKHKDAIQLLLDRGLAYRCYATEEELEEMRSQQKAKGEAPRYDNRYRDLSAEEQSKFHQEGKTAVVRFRIDDLSVISWNDLIRGQINWHGEDLGGDMVIARRAPADEIGDPLYNLAVVVDDSSMEISHVIRGEDHIANTAKQILLYKALGLSIPIFAHTPLILNQEGKKLSKRDGVTSISEFKSMGYTSEALANYMTLLGWSVPEGMEERFTIQEVGSVFGFDRVNKAGAKFDWDKLNWLNSQVIHNLPPQSLLERLLPLWEKKGWKISSNEWGLDLVSLIGPSLTLLNDGIDQAFPFFETPPLLEDGKNQLQSENSSKALESLSKQLEVNPWDGYNTEFAKDILKTAAESIDIKKGVLMKSLRASLLGTLNGPDLITSWGLLARIGKDRERLLSNI